MKVSPKRVSQLGRVVTGKTPPTSRSEYYDGAYPFVTPTDLEYNHYYCQRTERTVTEEARAALSNQFIPADAVLYTCIGATIGKCGIAPSECLTNQQINSVIANPDTDARFLYYLLCANVETFKKLGGGAATPIVSKSKFEDVELQVPELTVQQRIGAVLSGYDDLVQNNRRRMVLLEEAARLLYQEWFVRFRFPGHERVRVTKGLPEGWELSSVRALTTFIGRGIAPRYEDDGPSRVVNQKCIRDGRLDLAPSRRQARPFGPERQLHIGDVLVNSTGEGTLGRVAQVKIELLECTVDSHVTIVRPAGAARHYFGQALMEWEPRLSTMGRGATNQTELSRDTIGAVPVLVPPEPLLKRFEELADPVYQEVANLQAQNKQLRAARDLLLPRLMSGEIEV